MNERQTFRVMFTLFLYSYVVSQWSKYAVGTQQPDNQITTTNFSISVKQERCVQEQIYLAYFRALDRAEIGRFFSLIY